MDTSAEAKKLDPKVAWLFAAAAVVCGIVVSYGLKSQSWKVIDGVYAVLFGGLAFASTFLTSAKTIGVVGRFAAAGAVVALFVMWFVHGALTSGDGLGMIPSVPGFDGILKAIMKVGAWPFGMFIGIFEFLVVVLMSLFGAIVGSRIRAGKGYGLIPARR